MAFSEVATLATPVDLAWRDGDDACTSSSRTGASCAIADGVVTTVLDITDLTEGTASGGCWA